MRPYFASDGEGQPTHGMQTPQITHNSGENNSYIVYTGPNTNARSITHDHDTDEWRDQTTVGTTNEPNNDHGAPSICQTGDGTLHVFHGSHNGPQPYARSAGPNSTAEWVEQPEIGSALTYPVPVVINDVIYLFVREHEPDADNRWLNIYKSTDQGDTWSDIGPVVDWESDARIYHSSPAVDGTDIHFGWLHTNFGDGYRRDVYHAILDTTDDSFHTQDGTDLTIPIYETAAVDNCLVFDSNLEDTNGIRVALDETARPHILFNHDNGGTFEHRYVRWDDAASDWTSPETIAPSGNLFNSGDFVVTADDNITALLVTGSAGRGGDITRWAYDGTEWSQAEMVLDASNWDHPLGYPRTSHHDLHPDMQWVISESSPTSENGDDELRVFAWGDNGFVERSYPAQTVGRSYSTKRHWTTTGWSPPVDAQ